jgi:DnaK suppressor protein
VSKPPAKAAAASKTPAKSAKAPTKPAPVKAASKPAAKPAPKAAPKPAAKAAAKPAVKPAAKPAAKAPPKPAPKPASPPVSKAPAPAPAKAPTAKAHVAPVKASPKTPAPAAAPKAAATGKAAVAAPAPQPAPAPLANRFTDRFAPAAKPAARPMTETAELPKPVQKIDPKLANAWKSKPGRELSEPELLAMPESEYMNDKQLDFFRARLQQQKDDLLSSAGETTEHLREDTSIVPDPVDRATIEEEHALELRTRDRERKLLKKIAQSLARLDTGEYGYCDETGEPIGLQRLMARPTASLSLEAQQRRELKQKMFGD